MGITNNLKNYHKYIYTAALRHLEHGNFLDAALVFLLATSMFPNLVVASADSIGPSITVASAASSDTALGCMAIIACIGVPIILAYHIIVYRVFYGRLDAKEVEE